MDTAHAGDGGRPGRDRNATADPDFEEGQRRAFAAEGVAFESRYVDLGPPLGRVHVADAGDSTGDPPLLFVHGVMNFGAMFAPLVGRVRDARALAVDRPGWGLSADYRYDAATHRRTAVDVLEGVLDALAVERADVVGHSTGGYWALAFALARPKRVRRLVVLGGVPAFPGTSAPLQLRLLTVPTIARLLVPRGNPTPETVAEELAVVGESETIRRYPELVAARVAHDRTPRALPVAVSELRSFTTLRGWRPAVRLTPEEVRSVEHPVTVVWGDEDLLGRPESVRGLVESMPNARLVTVTGGHIPWLGHPDACAAIVAEGRA